MHEYLNLGDWITGKWKTQVAFAEKMGVRQSQISRWISGTNEISEEYQEKIRKLGYKGPWPERKAQEAPPPAGGSYVTEAAFEVWRKYWREGEEGILKRLTTLEDQVQKLRQQAGLE
jgi:transcriptional regulator with XRE-family HTH domain